ncbi:unnamed protein product [Prorocentrum cordatum]|uniref:Tyr recombinase domain-containing protein n=1 Tax=Prorocentrum cordatum TaxID=2364126 RepID=A0ABN9Q4M1_9DINO|nr:unnamed protein product [Polarella glacialis]
MNGMGCGSLEARPTGQREARGDERMLAWKLAQQYALQDAARYERDCRGLAPTGGHGAELAHDRGPQDAYTGERKSASKHVMMCASAVAEPPDDHVVDLLEALPEGERQCYSDELNVLDYSGKSGVIFEELEERFAFVGGSTSEHARYLMRDDLPKDMWTFEAPCDVQAYCGFSCVPKKDPTKQRKVLMMCASNYAWADPHQRGDHGMHGGAAMASMRAPTDMWGVAAFDEGNAFTRLRVPAWMARWQACPPLRACWVWEKLSQRTRDLVGPAGWVAPCYHRLAMGGSRSVHLLMTVNTAIIGKALLGVGARLAAPQGVAPPRGRRGRRRARAFAARGRGAGGRPSLEGYSVAGWIEAVKAAKREGMDALTELRCDGPHSHESAEGKLADGTFRTIPLAQYPAAMCEALGSMIVQTLTCFEKSGLGGTGWRRPPEADRTVAAWGTRSTTAPPVAVRNEDVLRGRGLVLDGPQMAFYLRVDDGVAMAGGLDGGSRATKTMHQLADALTEAGFVVTDRTEACDMRKVLGYAPQARPAQLRLPPTRARELVQQLELMSGARTVDTEELRSLLGIWIWGALLRREVLCIPSAVFRLLERYPRQRVGNWATVRRGLRAIAEVVPLMYADLGAPPAPVYFAADAMGANAEDDGGWGVLVTNLSKEIAQDFIDTGGSLGYTVARLDGELTGLRRPEQMIRRTKPFSLLPDRVFKPDEDWTIVGQGRWRSADCITLGEGRCVVKMSRLAAATPALHRTVLPILEDNQPASGAANKGRKLDSTSVEKVKPRTLAACRAAAVKFVTYLDENGFVPDGPEQWDDLLVEYKSDLQMTKCNFEYTETAVEFVFPRLRRRLTWSHSVIDAWRVAAEVKHAPPLGRAPANLAAIYFACWGVPRLGVGLLLQVDRGLRPSEVLQLRAKDISLPSSRGGPDLQPNWVINLGAKAGTKAKRMQFAIILERGGMLEDLLHRVVLGTPPEGLLFPYPLVDYRHRLRQFEATLGLDIHWTPHSARAGYASDSVARGIPFQEIKEAGRRLTESSLRIYVDVVTASRVLAQAEQRGIASLVREASEQLPSYFPQGIFGEDACGKHAADRLAQGGGRVLGAPSAWAPASPTGGGPPTPPPAPDLGELVDGILAGPPQQGHAAAGAAAAEVEGPAPANLGALQPLAARPQGAAAAAGQRRARAGGWALLRAAWSMARWCGRSSTRGVTWAAVAVWLIAWLYVSGPMAHFGAMMGVAASVSVSAGKVVDHSLGAVITAAQGEAWRGVDIADLRVHQRRAERIADDPALLQEWVLREFLSVEPRPPGADQVASALAEASVTLPRATERWPMMVWPGQCREFHMTYDLLSTGFYGVHVVDRIVNFSVQWSNPLRSGLECDLGSERDTIRLHINSTLSRLPLPAIRYMSMSDRELELAKLPGAWITMSRRLFRALFLAVKSVLQLFLFGQ